MSDEPTRTDATVDEAVLTVDAVHEAVRHHAGHMLEVVKACEQAMSDVIEAESKPWATESLPDNLTRWNNLSDARAQAQVAIAKEETTS